MTTAASSHEVKALCSRASQSSWLYHAETAWRGRFLSERKYTGTIPAERSFELPSPPGCSRSASPLPYDNSNNSQTLRDNSKVYLLKYWVNFPVLGLKMITNTRATSSQPPPPKRTTIFWDNPSHPGTGRRHVLPVPLPVQTYNVCNVINKLSNTYSSYGAVDIWEPKWNSGRITGIIPYPQSYCEKCCKSVPWMTTAISHRRKNTVPMVPVNKNQD